MVTTTSDTHIDDKPMEKIVKEMKEGEISKLLAYMLSEIKILKEKVKKLEK